MSYVKRSKKEKKKKNKRKNKTKKCLMNIYSCSLQIAALSGSAALCNSLPDYTGQSPEQSHSPWLWQVWTWSHRAPVMETQQAAGGWESPTSKSRSGSYLLQRIVHSNALLINCNWNLHLLSGFWHNKYNSPPSIQVSLSTFLQWASDGIQVSGFHRYKTSKWTCTVTLSVMGFAK